MAVALSHVNRFGVAGSRAMPVSVFLCNRFIPLRGYGKEGTGELQR
jgi:hypothetical protein